MSLVRKRKSNFIEALKNWTALQFDQVREYFFYFLFSKKSGKQNRALRSASKNGLINTIRFLASRGIKIDVVYDIGARHGEWTRKLRTYLPKSKFFLFEANETCRTIIQESGNGYHIGILSDTDGEIEFYSNNSSGDSIYKELTTHYEAIKPKLVACRKLDSLLQEKNFPKPDFIKIDTQGSELDILNGGRASIARTSLILLECPILKYNQGAPTINDYIERLDGFGFSPCEICDVHYADGIIFQLDLLFIRKDLSSHLQNRKEKIKPAFKI